MQFKDLGTLYSLFLPDVNFLSFESYILLLHILQTQNTVAFFALDVKSSFRVINNKKEHILKLL